jgi:hypothetical protein
MAQNSEWGPLAALIGEWEGNEGTDFAYANARGETGETKFREKMSMKPFGPVENGTQVLYGLDYRTAAWRTEIEEENPFHTEVGYWLWDAADNQVMRCFMVARGSVLIAGGTVAPDATTFELAAECGSEIYGILSNPFLAEKARTAGFTCTVTVHDENSWSYDECSTVEHARFGATIQHTDRNTLRKVG